MNPADLPFLNVDESDDDDYDESDDEYEWDTRHRVASFAFSMLILMLCPFIITFIVIATVLLGPCQATLFLIRRTYRFWIRHVLCRLWRWFLERCRRGL